ncbi:MAG: adenosylcobinamide-GDP ribazoletransferase, partial [Halocynthiibacter sp.]
QIAAKRSALAAWAYPVAGAIIGAFAALLGATALRLGLPDALVAALMLGTLVASTGAMHEDGLADTFDGLWGGWDKARRLEIMKDSRIGVYGVIALVLVLLARWAAITTLLQNHIGPFFLIGIAAISRAPMVGLMAWLPLARDDGLSASVGAVAPASVWPALGAALVIGLASLGLAGFWAMLWAAVAAAAVAFIARAKIGGQTGDILGASQQMAELAAVMVFATIIAS